MTQMEFWENYFKGRRTPAERLIAKAFGSTNNTNNHLRADEFGSPLGDIMLKAVQDGPLRFPPAVIHRRENAAVAQMAKAIKWMGSAAAHGDIVGHRKYEWRLRAKGADERALVPYVGPRALPGRGALSGDVARFIQEVATGNHRVVSKGPILSTSNIPSSSIFGTLTNQDYHGTEAASPESSYPVATAEQAKAFRKEDAEKAKEKEAEERKKKRQSEAIAYEKLTNREKQIADAKEKFGDDKFAEKYVTQKRHFEAARLFAAHKQKIDAQDPVKLAQKEFPYLKLLANNNKTIAKNLPAISKWMLANKKNPIVGSMMKHPRLAAAAAVLAGARFLDSQAAKADEANAKIVGWQNATNLYGKPSKEFMKSAFLAGYDDPGKVSKLYGQLTEKYGDPELFIKTIGPQLANLPPIARMAMARSLGLDADSMAMIDIMSNNGHLGIGKNRETNAKANWQLKVNSQFMRSTEGSLGDHIGAIGRDFTQTWHLDSRFMSGDRIFGYGDEKMNEQVGSFVGAQNAASSLANQNTQGISSEAATSSRSVNVTSGDIVINVGNSTEAPEVVGAAVSKSVRKGIAIAVDSKEF